MQSNKVNLEKRDFEVEEKELHELNLTCWRRRLEKYSIHIFSTIYASADEAMEKYATVRDYVAMFFQSETLELDIERWNMYEFIFVCGEMSQSQKQSIEQDKFATRKIVFDGFKDQPQETYIRNKIIDELFSFEVPLRQPLEMNVVHHLNASHAEAIEFMANDEWTDNTTLINELINALGNVKNQGNHDQQF